MAIANSSTKLAHLVLYCYVGAHIVLELMLMSTAVLVYALECYVPVNGPKVRLTLVYAPLEPGAAVRVDVVPP